MKWTTWGSIALLSLALTSCGGGGGESGGVQSKPVSSDSRQFEGKPVVAVSADCTQLDSFFSDLLILTNQARQARGLNSLTFSYQLGQAAQSYAEEMATQNFFSHTGKNGSTLGSRIGATGYQYSAAGENLAAGQSTALSVFQGWMNSEGHRANILNDRFTEVGFGLFDSTGSSDYGLYWVQKFGKPQSGGSQTGPYIPTSCGTAATTASASAKQTVAGIFITAPEIDPTGGAGAGLADRDLSAQAVGIAGSDALLSAVSQADTDAESVPEPAILAGLAMLGLSLKFAGSARR